MTPTTERVRYGYPAFDESDGRERVWLAQGITCAWRICSYERDYGEFPHVEDALEFKRLLVLGNPGLCALEDDEEPTPVPYDQERHA